MLLKPIQKLRKYEIVFYVSVSDLVSYFFQGRVRASIGAGIFG